MNAVAWMFLISLIGGLAYLIAFRIGARAERRKRGNRHGATSISEMSRLPLRVYKFRAVELRLCENPCESALGIAGKRLLKSEAPSLPLAGCPHKKCMCAYIQYDDRRFAQRRDEFYRQGMTKDASRRLREERRKAMRDRRGRNMG